MGQQAPGPAGWVTGAVAAIVLLTGAARIAVDRVAGPATTANAPADRAQGDPWFGAVLPGTSGSVDALLRIGDGGGAAPGARPPAPPADHPVAQGPPAMFTRAGSGSKPAAVALDAAAGDAPPSADTPAQPPPSATPSASPAPPSTTTTTAAPPATTSTTAPPPSTTTTTQAPSTTTTTTPSSNATTTKPPASP